MNVLQHQVFTDAITEHPKLEGDIKALYAFLSRTVISTRDELQELFPGAQICEDETTTQISIANGKLYFRGNFHFAGQFVIATAIQPNKS